MQEGHYVTVQPSSLVNLLGGLKPCHGLDLIDPRSMYDLVMITTEKKYERSIYKSKSCYVYVQKIPADLSLSEEVASCFVPFC